MTSKKRKHPEPEESSGDEEESPSKHKKKHKVTWDDLEHKNYYLDLAKKYLPETIEYPNEELMKLPLPAHILTVGYTGAGKTNWVRNFIDKVGVFTKIYLFAKDLEEPLWKSFIDKMKRVSKALHGHDILFVSSDIGQLPNPDDVDDKHNNLFIFDDMITEKEARLRTASEYFIRIRKRNGVCVFLTHSYFKTPQLMRLQASYIAVLKLGTVGDMYRIMREQNISDLGKEGLKKVYNETCGKNNAREINNFLLIDKKSNEPGYRFRHNYAPIHIQNDEDDTPVTEVPSPKKRKRDSDTDSEDEEHTDAIGVKSRIRKHKTPHPNPFSKPIILQGLPKGHALHGVVHPTKNHNGNKRRRRGSAPPFSFHIPPK